MSKKILVVDDNRVMLRFLTNLLERENHEVLTAEDGFSALDTLTSYVPDIIILDLIMPKIGGDKLCRIVRKMAHLKDCFIVVVSAAVAEMDFDYTAIGADTCIAKGPFATMAKNILAVIEESDQPDRKSKPKSIMGLEAVYARRMTKELLSRNRHLETILESISEGILEVYSGRVVYANSSAVNLFGMAQEKLLATDPLELFKPDVRPKIMEQIKLATDTPEDAGQETIIDLNGRLVTVKAMPFKGEGNSHIIIITDITERKRLELQLQHIQKMEAIGTIASGVAHNFRNTLAGILVNSQVLQMSHKDVPGLNEVVNRINTSVKRGAALVSGLTQFARKDPPKDFQSINLTTIINDTHQLIRESFDKKIEIDVSSPESIPVQGDQSGLNQALMNLCTNARDAMPNGGKLSIEAVLKNNSSVIMVSDSGMGMSKTIQDKCFDPFFTTKEVGKGTGLGLSTTYGIIQSHNGDIRVVSEPGKGAKFVVTLPLAKQEQEETEGTSLNILKGNGEKLLVVDDEPEILTAMPELLQRLNYETESVQNGMDAIDTYKRFKPDLVLMDKNMPGMDGVTCSEKIKQLDPSAKIIIVSGYDQNGPDGLAPDKNDLIVGYLKKPVDICILSAKIHEVLNA